MSHIRDTAQLGYYDDDKNYGSLRLLLKKLYYGVQLGKKLNGFNTNAAQPLVNHTHLNIYGAF